METVFIALRVLVVLAVIVLVLWYVQRRVTKGRGASRRTNAVNVVGRQGIGPKASVVVVDVDGNRFVLGVTERQVSVLHTGERPHDADVRPLRPVRKTFAKELPGAAESAPEATGTGSATGTTGTNSSTSSTDSRQDADFLTAQGRASLFDEALKGSILSPATWRQASSAVRPKK
ncbi:flagellar biosynthetic protein FliO [Leifsonia sp. 71-9]|uniref:flagellar biosynthetic protein FliO n=1 Tax=Leifsonia sp. 71-9 TaxID=1895934 RepID=UPI0009271087|nr:flagellar biosynthetic protein FliO [Leifsonia sp. 71-9]OJX80295.1 MAG: flagellar biosynthetic protein FliO [Leifsonia sp. 71-9]